MTLAYHSGSMAKLKRKRKVMMPPYVSKDEGKVLLLISAVATFFVLLATVGLVKWLT